MLLVIPLPELLHLEIEEAVGPLYVSAGSQEPVAPASSHTPQSGAHQFYSRVPAGEKAPHSSSGQLS